MDRNSDRPARRRRAVGLFFLVPAALAVSGRCPAREPLLVPPAEPPPLVVPEPGSPAAPVETEARPSGELSWARLMRELSQEVIPPDYEVRRDWGDTAEVFAGFNVRTENGRLRVSKRTRRVNHGLWRRFRVQLVRPEDRLRIELRNVQLAESGGLTAEVVITARLRCTADAVYWNYGARGPDMTVLSDMTLRAVADWKILLVDRNPDAWIPEFSLALRAERVRLRVLDFDVRRVGLIGGELADELGDASRGIVEELLERQEPRVLRRLRQETGQLAADEIVLPPDVLINDP